MRKILAVILLVVVVVIGLIVGLHSRNVYRFSYNYDVSLSYGGQKNATVSNVKLIVPYPFSGLYASGAHRYQLTVKSHVKTKMMIQITATKIDFIPIRLSPKNLSHSTLPSPRYGPVEKGLLHVSGGKSSSKPLNALFANCSLLPYVENTTQNQNRTLAPGVLIGQIPVFISYNTQPDTVIQLEISLTTQYSSDGARFSDCYTGSLILKGSQNGWFNVPVYETKTVMLKAC